MTFDAEYMDAEYMDQEYTRYVDTAGARAGKRVDWAFWVTLGILALVVYTAAWLFEARRSAAAVVPNLDLHDCSFPEIKADLVHTTGTGHDIVTPYAHSVCREGDVRLWESTH